jgi:hypothetical protein
MPTKIPDRQIKGISPVHMHKGFDLLAKGVDTEGFFEPVQ